MNKNTLRIATFQRHPIFDDLQKTTVQLQADMRWCRDQGVELAVFPESYLLGYSSDAATIAQRALATDGAAFQQMLSGLATFETDIIVGFFEQAAAGICNSAAVIRQGKLLGTYAKQYPNERGVVAGTASPVFDRAGFAFGINICNDANYPECAMTLRQRNASLLCYPLNNMLEPATAEQWRSKSLDNLRQRAIDTGCWVASSDVVGTHEDKISHGCTCIITPDGSIVARVAEGEARVIVFDIHAPSFTSIPATARAKTSSSSA